MDARRQSHTPAARDGVGPSTLVLPAGGWATIAQCLIERFPAVSRAEWQRRFDSGAVIDAHGNALSTDSPFAPHLRVHYFRSVTAEERIPFEERVIFQDEHLVVADKPHFLPVMPAGRFVKETLLVRLKQRLGIDSLVPIHRIDSGTAGVVMFCVRADERDSYQALFRAAVVEKTYESIGAFNDRLSLPRSHSSRLVPDEHFMRMREAEGEANSTTVISRAVPLEQATGGGAAPLARYELRPLSGRKHQLRVHCASLGIGILNDQMYPVMQAEPPRDAAGDYTRPLQLLARSVRFRDPVTGEQRHFASGRSLCL